MVEIAFCRLNIVTAFLYVRDILYLKNSIKLAFHKAYIDLHIHIYTPYIFMGLFQY